MNDPREWFVDWLDALNRHDRAALRELMAPGVRRAHLPGGVDAWIGELDSLFAAFPDFRWKRIGTVVEDDRIAVHLRAGGTHRGAFRGIPATGRHVSIAAFGIHRIADGRVVEVAGTADGDALEAQLR